MHCRKTQLLSLLRISKTTWQILQIQGQLIAKGLLTNSLTSGQLLASFTSPALFNIEYAEHLFTQIRKPSTVMYNSMIKGYTHSSSPEKALRFFVDMRTNEILGDRYTYPFVLNACRVMMGLVEGREVHGEVVKRGFMSDSYVVNGLIGTYSKCREMSSARTVFDGLEEKYLVSWNSILGGYVGCGEIEEARNLFDKMPERDVASWSIMIDGYGKKLGDVASARALFDSMPSRDMVSWNSMIDSYTKVGDLVAARQLFDMMSERSLVSWSIMMDGYARHGYPMEALNIFRQMLCCGVQPDKVSVVGAVLACAQLGSLDQGRWIHMYMNKNRITMDLVVQTAMVDMYLKCGSVDEARAMFKCMSRRSIVSWNVMIFGLGMNGFGKEALDYFVLMEMEGILMDDLILLGVLTACAHSGLVSEGLRIFDSMKDCHAVEPKLEHYNCLVDLLGRAGLLDKAVDIIKSMPMKPNATLWRSLLLACRIHRNVALAEVVVQRLSELKADDCGVYVLLSNIYGEVGKWEDAVRVRKLTREKKMTKETGKSIIEIDGNVIEFFSGEKSCTQHVELELVVRSLSKMPMFCE